MGANRACWVGASCLALFVGCGGGGAGLGESGGSEGASTGGGGPGSGESGVAPTTTGADTGGAEGTGTGGDSAESSGGEGQPAACGMGFPIAATEQVKGDAEAGYHALLNEGYVTCGIPYALFPLAKPFLGGFAADPPLPGRTGKTA